MRQRRRAIPTTQRWEAAARLARHLAASPIFLRSQRIACYFANDGEMELQPVMQRLWSMGKECYLPVIHPVSRNRLCFLSYREGEPLSKNRFGIPEPQGRWLRPVPAWALDMILMPLVAFDGRGNRLGMGGGYYDRTLAFLRMRSCWHSPRLLGVAYGFQRVDALSSRPWDVPLEMVVTESGLLRF